MREAFDLAIDRNAIPQVVFNGEFTAGNQWEPAGNPYYIKEVPVPQRNVEKAKALLKAAGHPDLVSTSWCRRPRRTSKARKCSRPWSRRPASTCASNPSSSPPRSTAPTGATSRPMYIGWSGRTDPDGNLYSFVACKAPLNDGHYCNPEVDQALDESRTTNDPAARYQAYKKAAEILIEKDRPIIYLFQRKWIYGMTKALEGFTPYPDGLIRVVGVDLK